MPKNLAWTQQQVDYTLQLRGQINSYHVSPLPLSPLWSPPPSHLTFFYLLTERGNGFLGFNCWKILFQFYIPLNIKGVGGGGNSPR